MKLIQINKKIKHDYLLEKDYEAGIELKGFEVKSISLNNLNLKGSFCRFIKNELFIFGLKISHYSSTNNFDLVEEERPRKLLLHRRELNKLQREIDLNGFTIAPFKIYFNDNGKCKLELWLAKGKKKHDKRNDLKEKTIKRQIERQM